HSYPDPAPGRVKLPVPRQVRMTKTPVSAMLARPTGIRNFQPSSMSWSTRIRGRVHPTHMIRKTNRYVFSSHQRKGGRNAGPDQPPRKRVAAIPAMKSRLAYSATKKTPHRKPLYSVLKPATSSDSASGRLKGAR